MPGWEASSNDPSEHEKAVFRDLPEPDFLGIPLRGRTIIKSTKKTLSDQITDTTNLEYHWTPQTLLHNTRIMYCMSEAAGDPERAIKGFMSVAHLLEEPRLARLYTFTLRGEEATIDDIVDELGMPRTTAYSDTGTLVELGLLVRDEEEKTHTYRAVPITLSAEIDDDEYTITPTLIDAFGSSSQDQDLDLLLRRYGLGKLAAALTYAIPYVEGEMSERVAARELDLQYAFAIAVLHALREVVLDMRTHDPYFDQIRNARDHPPTQGA